jgi:hypothetical protein
VARRQAALPQVNRKCFPLENLTFNFVNKFNKKDGTIKAEQRGLRMHPRKMKLQLSERLHIGK